MFFFVKNTFVLSKPQTNLKKSTFLTVKKYDLRWKNLIFNIKRVTNY